MIPDVIPDDELRRRLIAGRELRGLDQMEVGRRLKDDHGLGAYDIGRVERGETDLFRKALRGAVGEVLNLPDWWFTAARDEFDRLLWSATPSARTALDDLSDEIAQLTQLAEAKLPELEGLLRRALEADKPNTQDPPNTGSPPEADAIGGNGG